MNSPSGVTSRLRVTQVAGSGRPTHTPTSHPVTPHPPVISGVRFCPPGGRLSSLPTSEGWAVEDSNL